MILEDLGYNKELENYRKNQNLNSFDVARVISVHRDRYVVKTALKEYDAEIIGNLRYMADQRSDLPAVGDWVAISEYEEDKVLIHAVYPRKTVIERQAVGKYGEKQIIATNIDYAFIVQAADRDFNLNRIERYLTVCNESDVKPIIIINKIDLINDDELKMLIARVHERTHQVPVFAISNESQQGIESLKESLEKGKTYCLLGSSGIGKSSLLNNLSGKGHMKTNAVSASTNKGKHVTTHRELLVLDNSGILIDNPGMREVGIADSASGLERTFDSIIELSKSCKFKDCTHQSEMGCAVLQALTNGELDEDPYENYLRMVREKEHFISTIAERRKKDKDFGKMIKTFKKDRKSNKH